jgi:TonB family protein
MSLSAPARGYPGNVELLNSQTWEWDRIGLTKSIRFILLLLAADGVLMACANTTALEAQSLAKSQAYCAAEGKQFLWHDTETTEGIFGRPDVMTNGSCVGPGQPGYETAVAMNPASTNTAALQTANPSRLPGIGATTSPVADEKGHDCADRYYPPIALRLKEEGTVRVRITVEGDGSVSGGTVVNSSGFDALDRATVKCISGWHYKPAMKDGQPVIAQVETNIVWKLPSVRP